MRLGTVVEVSRKELGSYFSSPIAFVFLGTFLLAMLFSFFWVERFFARNIADVRPLFEWLPLLLIFLVAALTMRMWSEERRAGTVEFLMTLPVKTSELVAGKLLACLGLVGMALLLTLPLPVSVSLIGDLDWGPVLGGYVATLFVAAAYASIGLWVSSRTDSQIVSLIATVLLCLVFYMLGSDAITAFFGNRGAETLYLLSPASRFESITRGVLDVRDLYYYLSLIGFFFALCVYSLERLRWLGGHGSRDTGAEASAGRARLWRSLTVVLVLNLLIANIWLHKVRQVRIDLTADRSFTISQTTRSYLGQLSEPLRIRGYFSSRTHPLLAPLVPQLRDLLREYAVASNGRVRVEFIDPRENEELEEEANRKFGIRPMPFQIADRHQASVVNSYFDVVIEYGDKHEVLGFRDLIEVKTGGETQVEVRLRNPEYDITRSIRKVLYGFQGLDHLFEHMSEPLQFTGYISSDSQLPEDLREFRRHMAEELEVLRARSNGKFEFQFIEPDEQTARRIAEQYGFQPLIANIFDPRPFYFYMVVESPASVGFESIPIPADLTRESFNRALEGTLQRFSPGFLRRIGMLVPASRPSNPMMRQLGMGDEGRQYSLLRSKLSENFTITDVVPGTGTVPGDVDLLLVLGPKDFSKRDAFAIDQFLMRGGTVIVAASPFEITRTANDLNAQVASTGLEELLEHFGVTIDSKLVLDPQSDIYAIPVTRTTRTGFTINEVAVVRYPYFPIVRGQGLAGDAALLGGIPSLTMNWPSPISLVNADAERSKVTPLLLSSPGSWLSDSLTIVPPPGGEFRPTGAQAPQTVGVLIEGEFQSFFTDKEHPLMNAPEQDMDLDDEEGLAGTALTTLIERSSGSPRLFVLSSADFVADSTLQIAASLGVSSFVNSLQLIEDAIDWSLEDRALLSIRGRGHFARTLTPLEPAVQARFEYMHYGLALLGLFLLFGISRLRVRSQYAAYKSRGYKGV